jgi:3-oxoacyl-[acyl-carrier protein] reductase
MGDKGIVLITGASRGVGEKIALTFADTHFKVIAVSRNITRSAFYQSIAQRNKDITCYDADVTREEDVRNLMDKVALEYTSIDILVNNAGIAMVKPFHEITLKEWKQVLDINLTAVFLCIKYAFPLMKKEPLRKKHIFNMLSIASQAGFPGWSAYCAAKFGALGFTEAIRQELKEYRIRITGIISGATNTTLWDNLPGTWDKSQMLEPQTVADTIKEIYDKPDDAVIEKIVLMPKGGIQ